MPVWKTSPIAERPSVTLTDWLIFEAASSATSSEPTLHFVGYNIGEREGRVSSQVVEFDAASRRGRTKSGRVYELSGPPGMDSDASYVWSAWKFINEVSDSRDVTESVLADQRGPVLKKH